MPGLLSLFRGMRNKRRELRVLVLGLDNAGKTTILQRLCNENIDNTTPTQGFNVKTVNSQEYKLTMWDIGGQESFRPYWKYYLDDMDALIYGTWNRLTSLHRGNVSGLFFVFSSS